MVRSDVAARIVLLGDGRWAADSLAALRTAGHDIRGVVLRARPSDQSLAQAARRLDIPVRQPERINAAETVDWIARTEPDLIVSIACDQILRRPVRELARRGALNFHAGKLPFYRGRNVINWALINGEPEVGITAHFMDDGIDTGDIVLQRTIPVAWTDTYGTVLDMVVAALPSLAVDAVSLVMSGAAEPRVQRDVPGTYFGGRGPGDEWLDWSWSSADLHNFVRAISRPGPGARTSLDGTEIVIWRAFFDPASPRYRAIPGQVVGRSGDGMLVKTGDSTLLVQEIEMGGTGAVAPDWQLGTRLDVNRQPVPTERIS